MTANATKNRDPRAARILKVQELATAAFAQHEITRHLSMGYYRAWRCSRPNESAYWFDVVTGPGWIMVRGDLGSITLERTANMLTWVSSAIRDVSYFAEKVTSIDSRASLEEYDAQVCRRWLAQEYLDAKEQGFGKQADKVAKLRAELGCFLDDGPRVSQAICDSGLIDGCDFPNLNNWSHRFLWLREALKWFIENLPEAEFAIDCQ